MSGTGVTVRVGASRRSGAARITGGLVGLVVAVGAMLALAPGAFALTWGAPTTVSGATEHTDGVPATAMDANGDAIVAWTKFTDASGNCPCTVRAAVRTAGGSFGAPVDVSTNDTAIQRGDPVDVAMDSSGDAIVVWGEVFGSGTPDNKTYASVRPAGGAFGAPQLISGTVPGSSAQVAMDNAGDATIAWVGTGTDTYPGQLYVVKKPAGGAFGSPTQLTTSSDDVPGIFDLAMSPNGRAAIAYTWRHPCPTCMGDPRHGNEPENVQVVRAAAGGSFGSPTIVSQTVVNPWENIQGPYEHASSVVIDDNGDTVVGYNEASATWSFGSPFTDKLVTSDSGGSFSSPVTLGSANNAGVPQVTIAPDGESTAMTDTSAGALIASSRSLGGSFSSPATTVAPSVEDWTLTAASNVSAANGNALAALAVPTNSDQSRADLKAAVRPAGGSFPAPTLAGSSDPTHVYEASLNAAIDRSGDAAVMAWSEYLNSSFDYGPVRVSLAGVDTTPPDTTITAGPSGPTKDTTPTFSFTSSEAGSTFQCKVDGGSYAACSSPHTMAALTNGTHTFYVRAIDSASNVDPTPAARTVKVDTHAPSSKASAPASTHASPFTVSYTVSDPAPSSGVKSVELWVRRPGQTTYSKVATDLTPATRSFSYKPTAGAGIYRFFTRARDAAGNYEAAPSTPDATTNWSP